MADFNVLKATIASRIPDNTDQLIDAADVRDSFLDSLDEVNAKKQDKLESGVNIKTINGESLLGPGDIPLAGATEWGDITGDIDDQTDLKDALDAKQDTIANLATIESGAAAGATAVQPGDLASVATSGDYDDLLNKPTIPAAQVNADWDAVSGVAQILNKPTIPDVTGKADKVSGATTGDLAGLDANGNLTDSGYKPSDFATAAQGAKADTAYQKPSGGIPSTDLASAVQTSLGKADTALQSQKQADWNEADNTDAAYIKNKPTIPAAQVNADWNANSGVAEILNKPTVPATWADSPSAGGPAKKALAIPYGSVDAGSTSSAMTATVDNFPTTLSAGVFAYVRNGVVTSASGWTLDINGTGALPVYQTLAAASAVSSQFNINYTMLFVYNPDRVAGGCWDMFYGYNSDTNTIAYQLRMFNSNVIPFRYKTYRYRLMFTSPDGDELIPANTSTSTNATSARSVITDKINPFGLIWYYSSTSAINAGSAASASYLWLQTQGITLGYAFNPDGITWAMTAGDPVYLKCAPQTDGMAIIDDTTPIVFSLPSTNDGKIYIYLGIVSEETKIELHAWHPVYYHDGTGIRVWTGKEIPTVPTISTDVEADKASDLKTASPKAVYDFVGNPIVSLEVPSTPDGTIIATHLNGDTDTIDLNHSHSQYALKIEVESSQPVGGMAPNTLYNLGTLSGAVTFVFAAPTDNTILNEYMLTFDSDSTPAVPSWPNTITAWVGNCLDSNGEPVIAASKHYEVSVIGAYAYITEF